MSGKTGVRDTDKGMKEIRRQLEALGRLAIKAGIVAGDADKKGKKREAATLKSGKKSKTKKVLVDNDDGPTVLQYAAWNEYGVPSRNIPSRPFIRGFSDNNQEKIERTTERLYKQVADGKMDAETAIDKLGQFAQDGIKKYIRTGQFKDNAESTKRRKRTTNKNTPLIDTGAMRETVSYEVVRK
jgi:hypothetical protein